MLNRILVCMLAVSSSAYAASSRIVPDFEVHARIDKKNALLNFDQGAAAATITSEELDSILGVTGDFAGGQVPAVIVFDESVSDKKLAELANYQGRLKGTVQCKRVRLGSSPLFPHWKSAVLAEQCAIKSLNH